MPIRPLTSVPKATTRLMACMSPWSHVRRMNPRSKKLIHQHLHLHLSHSRKSLKKKNPKKWRLLYCLMRRRRRTPFKRMSRSLPWDGLQRSSTSRGVNPLFRTSNLWGFFRPTTLIGMQLWSTSTTSIRTLWRTLIGRQGCTSLSRMERRKHTSWTRTMRNTLTVPPWRIA